MQKVNGFPSAFEVFVAVFVKTRPILPRSHERSHDYDSIPVVFRLVGAFDGHAEVVGWLLGELGQLHADFFQVQTGGKSDVARPEITDDPLWRTDTNLNMIKFAESRRRI